MPFGTLEFGDDDLSIPSLTSDIRRMPPTNAVAETIVSPHDNATSQIAYVAAVACLVWYCTVVLVCCIGYTQIRRHYSSPRPRAKLQDHPHVTIIRPVKGLEPRLYDCLASTFLQDYPKDKLHLRFCISDREDPSMPVVKRLLEDYASYDAQLLLEEEDEALKDGELQLGPNPKIRNMSRAYREAVGDIIWVIDCNVWVAKGVCGRMVNKLEGDGVKPKYKLVHQLPLVVDIVGSTTGEESQGLLNGNGVGADAQIRTTSSATATVQHASERTAFSVGGGRFEELFMSSAHPKFYTAINTVLIAPCIVGKSTMFRRSHLNSLTDNAGIDYFSQNICEDHLIGDLLWKKETSAEKQGEKLGKHALCFGDLAFQPMANMSIREYWSRRVRWLRVRKFTVTLATLVEPGTESFLCSAYGAFAASTLPLFHNLFGIPQTWATFAWFWLLSVSIWCLMDRTLYQKLHSGASIEVDDDTPFFARPPKSGSRRPFGEWLLAWLGRESLALPIWVWAFWAGTRVEWRGKKFWVGLDMKVHEIDGGEEATTQNGATTRANGKARND
ncbi:glycosyltransferase family 21 protein [Zasmidium cellare ATCC 36951]|uniref:Ceramide glucosyltransferase n=1 Tax=Zasmidium cellare ATCC 36951 TaxID=1080233 RepID=A0A6A6D353_ZASCE|nr:glycosyltransferase family 21 protein [Zasmidium cellare ATCC 36951]KAF2172622.1 glycosyltransferase family 21 protein [Zasmidium cellare ATCC 36951]